MVSGQPFNLPVQFTGNGVIANGMYYPYTIEHIDQTYPQIDPKTSDSYLGIKKFWYIGWQTDGLFKTFIIEAELNNKAFQLYKGYFRKQYDAVSQIVTPTYSDLTLDIVCDKGTIFELSFPDGAISSFDCYVQYADLTMINKPISIQKDCDLWSWIKGECIYGD